MSKDPAIINLPVPKRRSSKSPSCLTSNADVILTKNQQKLIFQVWDNIPNHSIFWQSVYIQLFMHKPSLKSLFPFRELPADRLRYDESFNRQCYLVQNFMRKVIGLLRNGDVDQLEDVCRRVGRRHAHLTSVRFEPDWWLLFVSSTLDQLKPRCHSWCNKAKSSNSFRKGSSSSNSTANVAAAFLTFQWPSVLKIDSNFSNLFVNRRSKSADAMEAWRLLLNYVATLMSGEFYEAKAQIENDKRNPEKQDENVDQE